MADGLHCGEWIDAVGVCTCTCGASTQSRIAYVPSLEWATCSTLFEQTRPFRILNNRHSFLAYASIIKCPYLRTDRTCLERVSFQLFHFSSKCIFMAIIAACLVSRTLLGVEKKKGVHVWSLCHASAETTGALCLLNFSLLAL